MLKSKKPPIAEVVWLDACTTSLGEHFTLDTAKARKGIVRYSVGYLVRSDKQYTSIAALWDGGDDETLTTVSEITTIPQNWVLKIRVFGAGSKDPVKQNKKGVK